jgi:hypothetical protein
MSGERQNLGAIGRVPEFDGSVTACGRQPTAIVIPGRRKDESTVSL